MKKKLLLAIVVSMMAAMMFGGVASAHVHGITPLGTLQEDNADKSGAKDAQGDPIAGLIPSTVGQAPLSDGDGGKDAPVPGSEE